MISEESGRRSFLTNRRASRRRVWNVLMTRSAQMFRLSWERKPRRGRIFSRPGRDLTPRNNFWQISKTRLPRPLKSPVASLGIRKDCNMHQHPGTSCSGLGSICRRATWRSIRAIFRDTTTRSRRFFWASNSASRISPRRVCILSPDVLSSSWARGGSGSIMASGRSRL